MTDYNGIARLLSECPGDSVSLEWLGRAYDAKLALCEALEDIADSLPANVNRGECLHIAEALVPLVMGVHRYEEETLFPRIATATGDQTLAASIARLKVEHVEDACFAEELADTLARIGSGDETVNAETAGYMLRGFFESIRRHIAFERQFVLKDMPRAA